MYDIMLRWWRVYTLQNCKFIDKFDIKESIDFECQGFVKEIINFWQI